MGDLNGISIINTVTESYFIPEEVVNHPLFSCNKQINNVEYYGCFCNSIRYGCTCGNMPVISCVTINIITVTTSAVGN